MARWRKRPDFATHIVGKDVFVFQVGQCFSFINHPARNGQIAVGVAVFVDGVDQGIGGLFIAFVGVHRFPDAPAIVASSRDHVYFFNFILTDVAHPKLPLFVETKSPRIAQAVGVNLFAETG